MNILMDFLRWYSDNWFLGSFFLFIMAVVITDLVKNFFRWSMVLARGYPPCDCFFEEEEEDEDNSSE